MIFRKIAEWITGRKRDDSRHPLDYINTKYGEPVVAPRVESAPYKVEPPATALPPAVNSQITDSVTQAPAPVVETKPVESVNAIAEPAKCGCGRSPTGFCVGLHKLTTEEWSVHADNPNRAVVKEQPKKRAAKPQTETKKVDAKPAPKKAKSEPKKAEVKKPAPKKKAETTKSAPAAKKPRARPAR